MKQKFTDESVTRRQEQISHLRKSIEKYDGLVGLKNAPEWDAFKGLIENSIKSEDARIESFLSDDTFENYNYSKAKQAQAVKNQAKAYISAVEDADGIKADLRSKIKQLESEIKEAQEQEA